MWRVCVPLIICVGSGCEMKQIRAASTQPVAETRPLASMPRDRPVATRSAAQPEPVDLIPVEPDSWGGSYGLVGYHFYEFGPVGKRIISERRPEDMVRLKKTLEYTNGPRTVVVDDFLPVRQCDYATLIAETLLNPNSTYSFGPRAAYEYRDDSRRDAMVRLFGADAVLPDPVNYIYLDGNGKDISDETRSSRQPGTPQQGG